MKSRIFVFLLTLSAFTTTVATSCPVCFGETDTNTASAVNASIIVMLILIGAILSMFGSFILYLRKRARFAVENNSINHH